MNVCTGCGRPATRTSPTGQPMCEECFAQLGRLVVTGGASTNAGDVESAHRAEQARRLAAATGFWQRLRIRIFG